MIERLIACDRHLFRFLNDLHHPVLDPVMYLMSQTIFWIPFYAFLLYLIIRRFKTRSWVMIVGIVIAVAISDQVTSGFMKPYFKRYRPSHDPALSESVHAVNGYKGGQFGFASSHAANTFAVATFLWLLFRRTHRWVWLLFVWAVIVSYTRIYLGVHFPGDIIVGAVVGMCVAIGCMHLASRMLKRSLGETPTSP